jgi:GTP-binding protein SAR1
MSSILNWMYIITTTPFVWLLKSVGMYQKNARILVIGLDNAGKTTLLCLMSHDKILCHEPTRHPNMEKIKVGNVRFTAYDLGGHLSARRLWKTYYLSVDCIVFMIDASDYNRLHECKVELSKLLIDVPNIPTIVLGNKIDRHDSCNKEQLLKYLEIDEYNENIKVFMCSLIKRSGIQDAFEWLNTKL